MIMFLMVLFPLFLIPLIFLNLNILLSKKMFKERNKNSPFECGFDPLSPPRPPFNIQFFMISLIFLIFDIEIMLLFPLTFISLTYPMTMCSTFFFFMTLLIISLYTEYMEFSLDWKK